MPATLAFFLETALKSTALLTAAFMAAVCLRRKSAATRHQVWIAVLAAVLVLPFFSMLLPALRVPVANVLLPNGLVFRTDARANSQQPTAPPSHSPINTALPESKQWLLALWALGAAISFTQMAIGWAAVERMRRSAKTITMPGIGDDIDLRQTAAGTMPITYGFFRPVVLLPADVMERNDERRRVVLLHELAHVRRKDGATHLLARVALALYWWHPLVWAAWRESVRERERAADDVVLNAGAGASEYASHLLAIARSMQSPTAALAMVRPSELQGRLAAILDSTRNRNTPRRASALAASFAALAILLPVAALQAQNDAGQVAGRGEAIPLSAAAQLIYQGKVALSNKNYDSATSFFERAQSADSTKTAEARMWMAITQQRQNNLENADALYQSALSVEEPNSGAAATIMELYAAMLREQNKEEDAAKMSHQAASIRKAQAEEVMSMSQPSSPDVRRIEGDVKPPRLASKVEPEYTDDARLAMYSGSALLTIEIGVDGLPQNIKVIRSLGFGLDQKAVEAITKWKFKPGTLGGQPVAVVAQVEVNFRLL